MEESARRRRQGDLSAPAKRTGRPGKSNRGAKYVHKPRCAAGRAILQRGRERRAAWVGMTSSVYISAKSGPALRGRDDKNVSHECHRLPVCAPQGLKPLSLLAFFGAAKAAPSQKPYMRRLEVWDGLWRASPLKGELQDGVEVEEEGAKGVVGQMSGVSGGGRQATESGRERAGGDGVEFVEFPSLNCFR